MKRGVFFNQRKLNFSGLCEAMFLRSKNYNSVNTSTTPSDFGNYRRGKIKCSILAFYIFMHYTDCD